ncbi:MAG: hypothetical protein ACI82F_001988 [Planctomycetota bacterium]|jgi:hypothetical protein
MKIPRLLKSSCAFAFPLILAMSSCSTPSGGVGLVGLKNMWIANAFQDRAIENAVLTRRSIHDYHFYAGSARLNDLGRRDFSLLFKDALRTQSPIYLVRGHTPEDLFQQRMSSLRAEFGHIESDSRKRLVQSGLPGGSGQSLGELMFNLESQSSNPPTSIATQGNN